MERIINRRHLVAGAAALPIVAALPAEAHAIAPDAPSKPDISEIPGLDQIHHVLLIAVVRTPDGRIGTSNMSFNGFGEVHAVINTGDSWHQSVVPVDGLDTLPTWLQKQIGYTALTATEDRLPR